MQKIYFKETTKGYFSSQIHLGGDSQMGKVKTEKGEGGDYKGMGAKKSNTVAPYNEAKHYQFNIHLVSERYTALPKSFLWIIMKKALFF